MRHLLALLLLSALLGGGESGHPMLLWSSDELAVLRARVGPGGSDAAQAERALAIDAKAHPAMVELLRYAVLGDAKAGERQLKALRGFYGKLPPAAGEGDPNQRNKPWRDDRALEALRYDILHDLLTDDDRQRFAATAAAYVQWCIDHPGPWRVGDPGKGLANGERIGWLPNMQWTTMTGTFVLAAATRDRALIERVFNADGGFKWYFDRYLTDGRWYNEEFGKYYSNTGNLILWCEALERLGLGHLGYGYTGTGGATMRRYLENHPMIGLPERNGSDGRPLSETIMMGDQGRPLVYGYDQREPTLTVRWIKRSMNGDYPRMTTPLWWEAAHRRWPDAGFGWFLHQMRETGAERYVPSLYFGLPPLDPAQLAPMPAPSSINPERGFAMLRSEESPAYWTADAPVVAMQFGMRYVHYVHDAFCLLDLVAYRTPLYRMLGKARSVRGYAGDDRWRDHQHGQGSGIWVDGLRGVPVDDGEHGSQKTRVRGDVRGSAKFAAARATGIFPEVTQERALVLTREYLVDLTWLASDRPRLYDWSVNACALIPADAADWTAGADLAPHFPLWPAKPDDKEPPCDLAPLLAPTARSRGVGATAWMQELRCQAADAPVTAQTVGVRVHMLGAPGTALITATPPNLGNGERATFLMATRTAPSTCFAAVHEPWRGTPRLTAVTAVAETAAGTVIALRGDGIDDLVCIRTGDDVTTPATFTAEGLRLTVRDWCWLRRGQDGVTAGGGLTGLRLAAPAGTTLTLDGSAVARAGADGFAWATP